MILRLVRSVSFDINDSAKSRVDTYNIKKEFQEERLWRIKLCWMQDMEVVDNASDENNENTRRKATVVPIKIEYV